MPQVRINGKIGPIRQRIKISYDPQHGQTIGIPFESAGFGLQGLASELEALRVAYDLEPNERKSTLVAKPSGGQLGIPNKTVDEWQLLPNEQQLSIQYAPRAIALGQTQLDAIAKAVRDNEDSTFSGDAAEVFSRLLSGEAHFATSQQVLHHNTNVWDGYPGNVANVNAGRIYTTAQLLDECSNTNYWVYPIPAGIVGAVEAEEASGPPAQSGWQIGWRKLKPKFATAAGNRISVSTEYWFGQWDLFYYSLAT